MKTNNLKKRKSNILLATLIIVFLLLASALLFGIVRFLHVHYLIKATLLTLLFFFTVLILPKLLSKLFDLLYNYLCKNIDIIEKHLSDDYTPIFLNTACLKSSAICLHVQRKYFAKLEYDGTITIKVETDCSSDIFTEQTSDYAMFLSMFRFEE